jgi:hypothetical protein
MRDSSFTFAKYPWSFAMAGIDKPSEKEFVEGAFSSAPSKHTLAHGVLAAVIWRLLRK